MSCGCKGDPLGVPLSETLAAEAGSQVYHGVFIEQANGELSFTGRRFTSMIAAQRYADGRKNGVVRPVA